MVDYLLCHTDTERIWQQLSGNTRAGRVGISTKTIAKNFSLPIVHNNIHTASTQNFFSKLSTFSYNLIRPVGSFIGSHVSVIAKTAIAIAVVGLVGVGNFQAAQTSSLASADTAASGIDDLTQKELAVFVADLAGVDNVKQQAIPDTLEQISYNPQSQNVVKAQVIKTDAETRHDIIEHKVKEGETLNSIAKHYGVSIETIKWASDISSNTVQTGVTLTVPPIDGVIYTVEAGDTAKKLAETYKSNAENIIAFNDAELTGLKKGMKIIIPNGEKPAPAPVQTQTHTTSTVNSFTPQYGNGGYFYGWCTWWASNRRAQLGMPIPQNWGNANTWDDRAAVSGYNVTGTPVVGAVAQSDAGSLGHVGVVEEIKGDMMRMSDMNGRAGWGAVDRERWEPISAYTYIY